MRFACVLLGILDHFSHVALGFLKRKRHEKR